MTPPSSINDLPEAILLHIISFLQSDDAVKTSAVAPSWRNLWHSVPSLNFDMRTFHSKMPQKSNPEACQLFNQFIADTLLRRCHRHQSLHKFRLFLRCRNNGYTLNNIDLWLKFAIEAKVVDLDLEFSQYSTNEDEDEGDDDIFYSGSTIFSQLVKSSVEVLKLEGIDFNIPNEPLSRFESIREVHLENLRCTDEEIADLIASCIHLESLSLVSPAKGCSLENLKIVSQKLKHLTLNDHWEICSAEICAPSLISLNLKFVCAEKFALKKSSSLVEANVLCPTYYDFDLNYFATLVCCLSGVERLTIQNMWPNWFNAPLYKCQLRPPGDRVFSESFVYHNLKHVKLLTGFREDDIFGLQSLLKQCPQLVILVLVYEYGAKYEHYILDDMPADFDFQIPHLRLVEMKKYRACEMEEYVVGLLKKHGVVLEKIVAYPRCAYGESPPPFVL